MTRMPEPIYLVRHGESEWNVLRLTQGQTAHPQLTARGREQAKAAADRIAADLAAQGHVASRTRVSPQAQGKGPPVAVRSSDLTRAVQSAQVIATFLEGTLSVDPRLREQHLGDLEGMAYEQSWALAELHDWSDLDAPVAGGEAPQQVAARVRAAMADLDRTFVNVVVSHGDALRWVLGPRQLDPDSWLEIGNGAVFRVDGPGPATALG